MNAIRWIAGLWICLFFIFLPFPMEVLPDIGSYLSKLLLPFTKLVSGTPDSILNKTFGFSDSVHLYVQSFVFLLLAIAPGYYLSRSKKEKEFNRILRSGIALILGFFLLKYGLEKLTRVQFPEPPPNILYTPAGQLDKDILFWTLMGSSKAYAWFMGIVEIGAGLLLLLPKYRQLGSLISVGIFANILALNIGFDITVKLLAFALLFSSIFLLEPQLMPLYRALTGKSVSSQKLQAIEFVRPFWVRLVKGIAYVSISLECLLPLFDRYNTITQDHPIVGTFEILHFEGIPDNQELNNVRRIHFHPAGYLIFESEDGSFDSHPIEYSQGLNRIKLHKEKKTIHFERSGDRWIFNWESDNSLKIVCKKRDNSSLPLLQDQFHWTVEGIIEGK